MILVLCLLFLFHESTAILTPSGRRPSLLLLISDDLRADRVYAANESLAFPYKMPNVRRLMKSGLTFENAMSNFASCGPSRQSFLTGRTPDSLGVWSQSDFFRQKGSAPRSLPEQLISEGYNTVSIGKVFHYDSYYGVDETDSWTETYFGSPSDSDTKCVDGSFFCSCQGEECADVLIANQAVSILPRMSNLHYGGTPFFMAVGFRRPHLDWRVPTKWSAENPPLVDFPVGDKYLNFPPFTPVLSYFASELTRTRGEIKDSNEGPLAPGVVLSPALSLRMRNGYWASAAFMDVQLGRVLDALEANFLSQETIVIFLSDHGYSLGERTFWGKQTLRDEALRIPLVFSIPWLPEMAQKRSNDMVELIDIYPTLVSLLNLSPVPDNCLLGKDLSPILESDVPDLLSMKEFSIASYPRCASANATDTATYMQSCTALGTDTIVAMGYSIRNAKFRYTQWRTWIANSEIADWSNAGLIASELYDHTGNTLGTDPAQFENENLAQNPTYEITQMVLRRLLERTVKDTKYSNKRCGRTASGTPPSPNVTCTTALTNSECDDLFASRCAWFTGYGCQKSSFCDFQNKNKVTKKNNKLGLPVGTPGCTSFQSRCMWKTTVVGKKVVGTCTERTVGQLD